MNAPRLRKKDPTTEEKDEVTIVHNETKDTSTSHGKTHQKDRLSDSKKFYNYAALLSTVLFLVFICCKRFSVFKLQLHDYESGVDDQVWPLTIKFCSVFFFFHTKQCRWTKRIEPLGRVNVCYSQV